MDEENSKIKIVFVGEPNCGKSEIIKMYCNLEHVLKPTVFDTYAIKYDHNGQSVYLNICDTAGSAQMQRLMKMSYLDADVFILCIECINLKDNIIYSNYIKDLQKSNKPIILAVTKCDKLKRKTEHSGSVEHITSEMVTNNLELIKNNAREIVDKYKMTSSVLVSIKKQKSVKSVFDEAVRVYFDSKKVDEIDQGGCCALFSCCNRHDDIN